jgi:hypothetical protein
MSDLTKEQIKHSSRVESKKSIMSFFWENAFGSSLH